MSRVLVVEDELAIAELIALNLRHSGFEVVLARQQVRMFQKMVKRKQEKADNFDAKVRLKLGVFER